jgi:hypothetical protein
MKKLLRILAVSVLGIGLSAGAVSAATGVIDATGPDSSVNVDAASEANHEVNNETTANVTNNNPQTATSGDVEADGNVTAGDATTGTATNTSTLDASLTVNNSSSSDNGEGTTQTESSWEVSNTGPNADVNIDATQTTNVLHNNTTTFNLQNNVSQNAQSGNASVTNNNTGGNASSGNVSNSSNATVELNVTN